MPSCARPGPVGATKSAFDGAVDHSAARFDVVLHTVRPPQSPEWPAVRPYTGQARTKAQDEAGDRLSVEACARHGPSFSPVLRYRIAHLSSQSSKIPGVSISARMKMSRSEKIEFPACSTSCSRARWVLGAPS